MELLVLPTGRVLKVLGYVRAASTENLWTSQIKSSG